MELKEFISNTLSQIAEGVQEAIDTSRGKTNHRPSVSQGIDNPRDAPCF